MKFDFSCNSWLSNWPFLGVLSYEIPSVVTGWKPDLLMWLKAQEKGIVLLVMQKALKAGCCLSLEEKQYTVNWSFEKPCFRGFRSKCCCKVTFCCGRLFPTVSECLPSRHCDRALRGQTDHDPVTSVSSKSACLSLSAHMLLHLWPALAFLPAAQPPDWLTGELWA